MAMSIGIWSLIIIVMHDQKGNDLLEMKDSKNASRAKTFSTNQSPKCPELYWFYKHECERNLKLDHLDFLKITWVSLSLYLLNK